MRAFAAAGMVLNVTLHAHTLSAASSPSTSSSLPLSKCQRATCQFASHSQAPPQMRGKYRVKCHSPPVTRCKCHSPAVTRCRPLLRGVSAHRRLAWSRLPASHVAVSISSGTTFASSLEAPAGGACGCRGSAEPCFTPTAAALTQSHADAGVSRGHPVAQLEGDGGRAQRLRALASGTSSNNDDDGATDGVQRSLWSRARCLRFHVPPGRSVLCERRPEVRQADAPPPRYPRALTTKPCYCHLCFRLPKCAASTMSRRRKLALAVVDHTDLSSDIAKIEELCNGGLDEAGEKQLVVSGDCL